MPPHGIAISDPTTPPLSPVTPTRWAFWRKKCKRVESKSMDLDLSEVSATSVASTILSQGFDFLYTSRDAVQVGSQVLTPYGRGRVVEIRGGDHCRKWKVQLSSWKLANSCSVLCILDPLDCTVLATQKFNTMTTTGQQRAYVKRFKQVASHQRQEKHYQTAFDLYRKSITATTAFLSAQQLPTSCTAVVSQRAEWLIHTVKCSNSAASCAIKLELYNEALNYARNALVILQVLENKMNVVEQQEEERKEDLDASISSIETETTVLTTTPEPLGAVKLFGECRCQALLNIATALLHQEDSQLYAARKVLSQVQKVIRKYTQAQYMDNPMYMHYSRKISAHQKQLRKLKHEMRAIRISHKVPKVVAVDDAPYKATWFRPRRVWFFEDKASDSASVSTGSTLSTDDSSSGSSDSQVSKNVERILYGVVAVGSLAAAATVLTRHRRS